MDASSQRHSDSTANLPVADHSKVVKQRSVKRRVLFSLLVGGALSLPSTGCASRSMSLASMNPFKAKSTTVSESSNEPSMLASATQGAGRAATGVATATKNTFAKTTSTVGGWFGRDKTIEDSNDPLSLENNPEKMEPDVFVANGQLWESTGNMTKAMESYSKALETKADHGPALTSIARLHFREGNHEKSAEFFQKAIAQEPNEAALYNDLGLTQSKLGQHEMAAQTLTRALQLAPGTSRYANNLASVHFESGNTDQALKVLSENNKPAVAHFNMAFLHYKKGQSTQAQSHLTQALTHEHDASSDPATKRAVDRSREMLAQMTPAGTLPASANPTGIAPGTIGPAAGPTAIIAAAPAHKANAPGSVTGTVMPTKQPVVPGNTTPVAYQDAAAPTPPSYQPRASYQAPPTATPPATTPAAPSKPAALPTADTAPASDPAAGPSTGFKLPGGFQLPAAK